MALYPLKNADVSNKIYWKEGPVGERSINVVLPAVAALRTTPGSNFPAGGVFTNSTLRGSAQAVLARADTPDPIRVLICGHLLTDSSVVKGPQDTNLQELHAPAKP